MRNLVVFWGQIGESQHGICLVRDRGKKQAFYKGNVIKILIKSNECICKKSLRCGGRKEELVAH